VEETQYQVLIHELKGISRHLDEIKQENRQLNAPGKSSGRSS